MHVFELIEFLHHKVDGSLIDAVAADDRRRLAEGEKPRVEGTPETNVVGAERPAHGAGIKAHAQRKMAVDERIIEARSVVGDGKHWTRWMRFHLK